MNYDCNLQSVNLNPLTSVDVIILFNLILCTYICVYIYDCVLNWHLVNLIISTHSCMYDYTCQFNLIMVLFLFLFQILTIRWVEIVYSTTPFPMVCLLMIYFCSIVRVNVWFILIVDLYICTVEQIMFKWIRELYIFQTLYYFYILYTYWKYFKYNIIFILNILLISNLIYKNFFTNIQIQISCLFIKIYTHKYILDLLILYYERLNRGRIAYTTQLYNKIIESETR